MKIKLEVPSTMIVPDGSSQEIAPEAGVSQCMEPMYPLLIEVECYAGHKADEKPRRFCLERNWLEVEEVVDRWHQVERLPRWPRADYFKVQASDGRLYLLKHDLDADEWFLVRRWYEILRRPC